jgi:uncharacterized protein YaaR (DUF327 family)
MFSSKPLTLTFALLCLGTFISCKVKAEQADSNKATAQAQKPKTDELTPQEREKLDKQMQEKIERMNSRVAYEIKPLEVNTSNEDIVRFKTFIKVKNLSDAEIAGYRLLLNFKFASGKEHSFTSPVHEASSLKAQETRGGTNFLPTFYEITKIALENNPDGLTINEVRIAARDNTYTLQVMPYYLKRIDINDNFDNEEISIQEEVKKLKLFKKLIENWY